MDEELNQAIVEARHLIEKKEFKDCESLLRKLMSEFPDNAVPHNLMGLLYEKKNDHIGAMKHFRAAWALDPTYRPALMNLDNFGQMFADKTFIFGEDTEEPQEKKRKQGRREKGTC